MLDKKTELKYSEIVEGKEIGISGLSFEWDENKNQTNILKHGVSFNEAITVFMDENAVVIEDIGHSKQEERFIILGFSKKP